MPRPAKRCFACGARGLMPFYEQRNLPVHPHALLPTRIEALSYPKGDVCLAFCARCGFIQNVLYQDSGVELPSRTSSATRSARQGEYLDALAEDLIERYNLRGKSVVEIGCGDGAFLARLCGRGGNSGIGIDPASAGVLHEGLPMEFLPERYNEKHLGRRADFICSRQTLDHVTDVRAFADLVRRSIGEEREPVVFFEVPDVRRTLCELAFWDIDYDRCSYFSTGSLARLFRAASFDVFDLRRTCSDQYVAIEAVASSGTGDATWESENDLDELKRLVGHFRDHTAPLLHDWGKSLQRVRSEGRRAVLWGSGAKAASYLINLEAQDDIEFVVDLSASRFGCYQAGTGHQAMPPEFLQEYQPDLVIAMDRGESVEIRAELARLGIKAELIAI